MAKKIFLKTRPEPAIFTIIGISCHLIDYRLLHMLNKELGFNFTRQDDFRMNGLVIEQASFFSFYSYRDEDQRNTYHLLANFSRDVILIPELRNTDFIMIIDGEFKKAGKESLLRSIRSVPRALTAFEIKVTDIKNHEAFLTDLEMHITEIHRGNRQKIKQSF
jgi:hypothetical protein